MGVEDPVGVGVGVVVLVGVVVIVDVAVGVAVVVGVAVSSGSGVPAGQSCGADVSTSVSTLNNGCKTRNTEIRTNKPISNSEFFIILLYQTSRLM